MVVMSKDIRDCVSTQKVKSDNAVNCVNPVDLEHQQINLLDREICIDDTERQKCKISCQEFCIPASEQQLCKISSQEFRISDSDRTKCELLDREIRIDDTERQKCEIWSRVMGYYRPTDSYNVGKKSEYDERKCFDEPSEETVDREMLACSDCISQAA